MIALIKWLSRLAIAWSLAWISFGLGCIVRAEGGASASWHIAMISGHAVLLVVNIRTLLRQRMKEHSPNEQPNQR